MSLVYKYPIKISKQKRDTSTSPCMQVIIEFLPPNNATCHHVIHWNLFEGGVKIGFRHNCAQSYLNAQWLLVVIKRSKFWLNTWRHVIKLSIMVDDPNTMTWPLHPVVNIQRHAIDCDRHLILNNLVTSTTQLGWAPYSNMW
jgi:hypothetical protein